MKVPYVHSGYTRKENDDYQTVDPRCVQALVETEGMGLPYHEYCGNERFVDICGSHGSGIVRDMATYGYTVEALPEAFVPLEDVHSVITNPPYARGIVDNFVGHVIAAMERPRGPKNAYFLMRANWDFAISRAWMFDHPFYAGQLRMRFRPWWTEERKAQPIHNYVWHHWQKPGTTFSISLKEEIFTPLQPIVHYWPKSPPIQIQTA